MAAAAPAQPAGELRSLLYRAIVELDYVQSVENCTSGLCATSEGKAIVKLGMKLLGVKDLSMEWQEIFSR